MVTNGDIYHLGMTNIAMERSTIFKFGKPSTSIRAIYTMAMLNNHMVPSGKLTKLWKITIFNGKIYYKWPFSIAMLNYQMVTHLVLLKLVQ
jgi:hypothetical protein